MIPQEVLRFQMPRGYKIRTDFDTLSKTINLLGIELGNVIKDQAGNKRLWRLKGLSYNWNAEDPPKKYVRFRTFRLEQENGRDWFDMMANDAKLKREKGHTGIRGVFALVSGGQWEVYIVEPYDSHGTGLGNFGGEDFDYRDEYNEMFGWRALSYDRIRRDAAVRDYGGEYTETLEFRPEMSTSIE